jgi:oxygen-dependent protoporphyrinogen oxidase
MTSCAVAVETPPAIRSCYVFPPVKTHPTMPVIALEHTKVGGRVPPGKGLVSLFPPSEIGRALYDEPDDVVAKTLIEAAEPAVPGLADSVLWTYVSRKHPCVMQSRPGYWTAMREFRAQGAVQDRRVRLAGDYFCASNVNTASVAGERAARELIVELS